MFALLDNKGDDQETNERMTCLANGYISNFLKKMEDYFLTCEPSPSAWIQKPFITEMNGNHHSPTCKSNVWICRVLMPQIPSSAPPH